MKTIDEKRLETDLGARFAYLADFVGFGEDDIAAIHASAEHLGPLVPGLVDAVYDKLHQYDATWRHFVPRQHGYEGATAGSVQALSVDSETIRFRKQHLGRYLQKLVTSPYDAGMVAYLDRVGAMHTPGAGSPVINVPLVQMNALMGFVADALVATIASLGLPREAEVATLRAFNKLLWLQNDLINRHYADAAKAAA
ncbi:protoglobin family protein [Botrimarina sp.]|uniref:protoglobin family protein n=1 Tax=Botrimarina sp. TaxID=2795802 RepID=UPI0032ECB54A